jgi:hypothetical protein
MAESNAGERFARRLEPIAAVIEGSAARVRLGFPAWLRPFLQRGVIGITLGRRVYLSPRLMDRSEEEMRRIVQHELAHVRQVHELGLPRFLYRYVREYISLRRRGFSSSDAYRRISFEVEAEAAETRLEAAPPEGQKAL